MADEIKGEGWSGKPIGAGEGEVPLAPPPQPAIDLRTMASDLKSIGESGGIPSPQPYAPPPAPDNTPKEKEEIKKQEIFTPPAAEFTEITQPKIEESAAPAASPKPKEKINWLLVIIVLAVLIGFVTVGYFYAYPKFFGTAVINKEKAYAPTPPPPISEQNQVAEPTAEPTTPPPLEPTPPPPPEIAWIANHISAFKIPPHGIVETTISEANINAFHEALLIAGGEMPGFKEVVIRTPNGIISFYAVAKMLVPNFFTNDVLNYFDEDATYFINTTDEGLWFGAIPHLKTDANISEIQNLMSGLQRDPANINFFLTDPGVSGPWQDGKVKNKPTSLAKYSEAGAALSYTWFDRHLLISTNLLSAEIAATRLGF